jgi:NAD(P)-dependent dehydrogenase (short-subunit alcohol dehydrogenase family)
MDWSMAQVLIVTGGSRGIGAATAVLAAEQGYNVAFSFLRDQVAADTTLAKLRSRGVACLAEKVDVAVESEVIRFFERVDHTLGSLSVLVNNAGIVDRQARVEDMTEPRLSRMFAVNVVGSFLCAREAVRRMSTKRGGQGGAIVNVSSAAARSGAPGDYVDYAASKAAIDTFTIGLSKEVADEGIRVNAVRPGIIATEIHANRGDPDRVARIQDSLPMRRVGQAAEVAAAILWLASAEASYSTGAILDVSGGR